MKTTKKPMMAKRATKAAPAKKTMAAKKPMTVAGKTVKKYQVGGPAMGTMPKGMAGTLGAGAAMGGPRPKPTTTVTPVKTPPKTGGMLQQGGPRGVGGVQPPRFTNYGPGSGQFQNPMPRMPGQGMISNNGGAMMGQSPDYAQASELLSRMDPRSPFYNAIQQRVQQMGGMQSNNGAGMIANNPGAMMQGLQGLGRGSVSPQELQARQDAYRQQMMQQGMDPQRIQAEMARTTGVIGTPAPRQAAGFRKGGAVAKKKKPAATTRGRMAKPARKR